MSKSGYIGVSGVARKVKKLYVGVDGIARKVKKAYVGVDGVARLWFVSRYFEYTGNYTEQTIELNGKTYALYTLTSSGTLSCSEGRFWMCGGGSAGGLYTGTKGGMGGGGGYVQETALPDGEYTVVIGAGGLSETSGSSSGSESSITFEDGNTISAGGGTTNGYGGSAGGGYSKATTITATYSGHSYVAGPDGAGVSTIPFGIVSLWPHCPGGGGGAITTSASSTATTEYTSLGGWGGQNGGAGGKDNDDRPYGGFNGGGYGAAYRKGGNGSYYGAGGGGGSGGRRPFLPGSGYQGVAYVLQEVKQTSEELTEIPIYAKGRVAMDDSALFYNNIIIDGTTYSEEGDYTTAKGNSVRVETYNSKPKIYFNGTLVEEYTGEILKKITYTFTAQKPTLILCGYDAIYIIEEGT